MDGLLTLFRWVHIAAGATGLVVYWVPILTKKGGSTHRRFGTLFKWSAYVVLSAAALAIGTRLTDSLMRGIGPWEAPSEFAFMAFLGYLTIITGIMIRHGVRVLEHKADLSRMNRPLDRGLARLSVAASLGVVAYALYFSPPNRMILFALSPIGIFVGKGILDAVGGKRTVRNAWLLEHLGAMLGAGIAFHTAFAVFGLTRLFDLGITGWAAVLPWILPTLVGLPATTLWTRKVQRGPAPPARTIP